MSAISDQDRAWLHSQFMAYSIRKTGFEWQDFVTNLMHARHGGSFIQVDPGGRGDKGCDGWVDGLMLACYGASKPDQNYVTDKIHDDFFAALQHWGILMNRWAFVHNNANGLPIMAAEGVIELKSEYQDNVVAIEVWPPQVLWDHCLEKTTREKLVHVLGAPPSDHPAGMTYIARCVESLARTRLREESDDVAAVPFGKIEFNEFGVEVAELIKRFQVHTTHVRFYFSKATPGERAQVSENLRVRYDAHKARLQNSDAIFHALCDDLIEEAFPGTALDDAEEQRSAAMMVVTHFFESCEIFEMPSERV
ncbi:hypothetical protein BZB76_1062 [Actinomadura pelletieri DSM 43383]|uniref:ABC-three component systems C-terminal domain-containing protein n=2 Tax=Actinomadura pelletieri TaxID=111805 RepID=A0A495QZV2_9ACTN|nr:hypothetical protein BZB76_1062 [Actinomadura pelletieri DSM 43383]